MKDTYLHIRISQEEKELFRKYAKKHNLTISEAVRTICYKVFGQEQITENNKI